MENLSVSTTQSCCMECGKPLSGRSDKKYCDDGCRSTYNSRDYRKGADAMKQVNAILRQNRRILMKYYEKGLQKIHRSRLLQHGFSFEHHTSVMEKSGISDCYFTYEYGYLCMDDGMLMLVKEVPEEVL